MNKSSFSIVLMLSCAFIFGAFPVTSVQAAPLEMMLFSCDTGSHNGGSYDGFGCWHSVRETETCDLNPNHSGGTYDRFGCWHSAREKEQCDRNPYHHGGSYDRFGCWHG